MRKSTLVILAILLGGMGMLLWAFRFYTEQIKEEVANAKELTALLKDRLAPDSRIRLARVAGGPKFVVADPERIGLVCEASPSAATWAADPRGRAFAADVAERLFGAYPPDRRVEWVQVRLVRPDGTPEAPLGFERGPAGRSVPIEGAPPAPAPGGAPK